MSEAEPVAAESSGKPAVRGYFHRPRAEPSRGALVLAHGAGSNANAPLLVKVAECFAASGYWVLRCDLPFRQSRPHGPPTGTGALDRAGLEAAVEWVRARTSGPVYLGGHSYGGRQATMLAGENPGVAAALLLFSYPLHPPKQSGQLRTSHFPRLRAPALFVHGTRDPFGSVEEMSQALRLITAPWKLVTIGGSGHDLGRDEATRSETARLALLGFQDLVAGQAL